MRRDEVVRVLRTLPRLCREAESLENRLGTLRGQVAVLENALESLSWEEREIIEKMIVNPTRGAGDKLCEMLCVELPTVYRRRNKALQKL